MIITRILPGRRVAERAKSDDKFGERWSATDEIDFARRNNYIIYELV